MVTNGYHSGTTIKALVKELEKFLKEHIVKYKRVEKATSTQESFEFVKRIFSEMSTEGKYETTEFYLIVHSMDMGQLKGPEWQEMLAELAAIPAIKLIVTVDNCKSGVLFTDHQLDLFNFVCVQADTFQPIEDELGWQPSLFSAKNDNQELGLAFIFKSMTNNQREIIKQIAQYQLAHSDEKGIKQKDLLNLCVENMLAHSTKNLKEYLHEAKDHKII